MVARTLTYRDRLPLVPYRRKGKSYFQHRIHLLAPNKIADNKQTATTHTGDQEIVYIFDEWENLENKIEKIRAPHQRCR